MAMMMTTALPLQNIAESDVFNEEVMPSPKEGKGRQKRGLNCAIWCSAASCRGRGQQEGDVCVCESAILLL